MKYNITIEITEEDKPLINYLKGRLGNKLISMEEVKETRTLQQNSSLHLLFTQLAKSLNEKHMDMRAIIRDEIEIEWTGYSVKEYLWKPLQKALYGKKSTTELFKSKEIDKIYDYIVKIISERTNGEVQVPPFPSIETLIDNQ